MSRYKAYSEYKDSGIPWLGNVPNHWVVSKVKHLTSFQVGWTPPTKDDENFEGDNLWANISDLKGREIFETAKRVSDGAVETASMKIAPKGSLLYSFKLSVGAVSFAGNDMYTNEAIASFLEESKLPLAYLYYVLPKYLIENASTNIYGARILNQELICNANLIAPEFEEAQNIAAFLDHETAKIDALIEKQQRLIELLKEKRQAVISHAVTKGLSPNAPMKDSGVEWLGEVPAHWALLRVKFVCSFTTSGPRGWSELVGETGSLFIQSGDLTDSLAVNFSGAKRVQVGNDGEAKRTALCNGDVVVCITGAKTGNVALCDFVPEDAYINQHLCLIRPTSIILSAFLAIQLKSSLGQNYFELSQYGLKQGLSLENVREAPVLIPPSKEQSAIVSYLNAEAEKFDVLSAKAQHSKELLQERRTALISAAVTGKIDVRDWQAAA